MTIDPSLDIVMSFPPFKDALNFTKQFEKSFLETIDETGKITPDRTIEMMDISDYYRYCILTHIPFSKRSYKKTENMAIKIKLILYDLPKLLPNSNREDIDLGNFIFSHIGDDKIDKNEFKTIVCQLCPKVKNESSMLLCNECGCGYHTGCLKPPQRVPKNEWFCDQCLEEMAACYPPSSKSLMTIPKSQDFLKRLIEIVNRPNDHSDWNLINRLALTRAEALCAQLYHSINVKKGDILLKMRARRAMWKPEENGEYSPLNHESKPLNSKRSKSSYDKSPPLSQKRKEEEDDEDDDYYYDDIVNDATYHEDIHPLKRLKKVQVTHPISSRRNNINTENTAPVVASRSNTVDVIDERLCQPLAQQQQQPIPTQNSSESEEETTDTEEHLINKKVSKRLIVDTPLLLAPLPPSSLSLPVESTEETTKIPEVLPTPIVVDEIPSPSPPPPQTQAEWLSPIPLPTIAAPSINGVIDQEAIMVPVEEIQCSECKSNSSPEKMQKCDICRETFHVWCLTFPLIYPEEGWTCDNCTQVPRIDQACGNCGKKKLFLCDEYLFCASCRSSTKIDRNPYEKFRNQLSRVVDNNDSDESNAYDCWIMNMKFENLIAQNESKSVFMMDGPKCKVTRMLIEQENKIEEIMCCNETSSYSTILKTFMNNEPFSSSGGSKIKSLEVTPLSFQNYFAGNYSKWFGETRKFDAIYLGFYGTNVNRSLIDIKDVFKYLNKNGSSPSIFGVTFKKEGEEEEEATARNVKRYVLDIAKKNGFRKCTAEVHYSTPETVTLFFYLFQ